MEKEIKITPPEGYEIDRENSTFDCIKFKHVTKRWRDGNHSITGFNINNVQVIKPSAFNHGIDNDIFVTKKQAKSALAMAQISQIMANDERFGGVVTDEEWDSNTPIKYVIERYNNGIRTENYCNAYSFLSFHTSEQRDLFLKENEDLVRDYLMLN